jgi:hypothetical protein
MHQYSADRIQRFWTLQLLTRTLAIALYAINDLHSREGQFKRHHTRRTNFAFSEELPSSIMQHLYSSFTFMCWLIIPRTINAPVYYAAWVRRAVFFRIHLPPFISRPHAHIHPHYTIYYTFTQKSQLRCNLCRITQRNLSVTKIVTIAPSRFHFFSSPVDTVAVSSL